jgi:hypothetical protein
MRKRVEYGPTTSKLTPDGMKIFTTLYQRLADKNRVAAKNPS